MMLLIFLTTGYAGFDVVELPSSEPSIDAEALTAITYVTSLLALIFLVAFTATLIILLVHLQCHRNHSNHGTLMQTPEANYSTVGPPIPPVRIERNMSYEERVIQTDNHSIVGHMHDTSNCFTEANDNADLDNTLQSQLVLNESAETGSVPTNTSIINMLLLQRSDTKLYHLNVNQQPLIQKVSLKGWHNIIYTTPMPRAMLPFLVIMGYKLKKT